MGTMTICIISRGLSIYKGTAACIINSQIRVVKINSRINDPGSFSNAVSITNPANIPCDEPGLNYFETCAECYNPVGFHFTDGLIILQQTCLLWSKGCYKPSPST